MDPIGRELFPWHTLIRIAFTALLLFWKCFTMFLSRIWCIFGRTWYHCPNSLKFSIDFEFLMRSYVNAIWFHCASSKRFVCGGLVAPRICVSLQGFFLRWTLARNWCKHNFRRLFIVAETSLLSRLRQLADFRIAADTIHGGQTSCLAPFGPTKIWNHSGN